MQKKSDQTSLLLHFSREHCIARAWGEMFHLHVTINGRADVSPLTKDRSLNQPVSSLQPGRYFDVLALREAIVCSQFWPSKCDFSRRAKISSSRQRAFTLILSGCERGRPNE